jgi:prepilin-type N-terminal cleavage/methylation domain-containing protein
MLTFFHRAGRRRVDGFTLIELVVVLAILGILIALAVPRYLGARKKAYKAEADNILQEAKTMEWAYYQQYNSFDTSGNSIGLVTPGNMHWRSPAFGGNATSIEILMSGQVTPLGATDSVWIVLQSDGSSGGGSSF